MHICRICGNDKGNPDFAAREMMFGLREKFTYFECSACGCLQITDVPASMERYYPSTYYSFNTTSGATSLGNSLPKRIRNRFAAFGKGLLGRLLYGYKPDAMGLKSLARLSLNTDTRIIDVGCGDGKLLCSLRELGLRHLLGVDPFIERDIEYQNGVKIVKDELAGITGTWDVIMFHHSFEHIFDQPGTLLSARRLLDEQGTCLIRVPVASSFAWRQYGVDWFQLDAPRHFFLHSLKSMSVLAERAGMYVEKVVFDSTDLQFTGSELYKNGTSLLDEATGRLKDPASFFPPAVLRKYAIEAKRLNSINDGDQAAFYLKKTHNT